MEVRRSEASDAKGKADSSAELRRLFYSSVEDRNRAQIGLPPMPKPVPPPPPPSEERTKEILNDDRVKVGVDVNTFAPKLNDDRVKVGDDINAFAPKVVLNLKTNAMTIFSAAFVHILKLSTVMQQYHATLKICCVPVCFLKPHLCGLLKLVKIYAIDPCHA